MSLAREQARSRVEPDPARARQIDLAPRVQIREVLVGAGGTVEGLHVRDELNEVTRGETRREPEVAQELNEQPRGIAARARSQFQRLLWGLHARLHADQVTDHFRQRAVEVDQPVHRAHVLGRNRGQQFSEQRCRRQRFKKWSQLAGEVFFVGEGPAFGVLLDEEVERIDDGQVGDQIDGDRHGRRRLVKNDPRLPVALGILLPVDEVIARLDGQSIGSHRGPTMGRRAQADDLRRQGDRPVVSVGRSMMQGGGDGHGLGLRAEQLRADGRECQLQP